MQQFARTIRTRGLQDIVKDTSDSRVSNTSGNSQGTLSTRLGGLFSSQIMPERVSQNIASHLIEN
jgi:hypothetical protein